MNRFVFYIGAVLTVFNFSVPAAAAAVVAAPRAVSGVAESDEVAAPRAVPAAQATGAEVPVVGGGMVEAAQDEATAQDEAAQDEAAAREERRRNSMAAHINDELVKLFMLPFIADKLFEGEKINQSMLGFLRLMYPTTDVEKLAKLESALRPMILWKRKYDYAVAKLKHRIKAFNLLPKDAPVVAADGEYAALEEDLRKAPGEAGEYQVRYRPFKYLEYDRGRFGEPVRRRDKNYDSPEDFNSDEIALALLRLDFKGFMEALGKMPAMSDGADEKPALFGDGGRARLLADTSKLGDKKKIYAVLEVQLPEGMYINGDYLNPAVRPAFIPEEEKVAPAGVATSGGRSVDSGQSSRNVQSYRLYQPMAGGVESNGQARRVLAGNVRFPLEITRADTDKSMRIAGKFRWTLCDKSGNCQPMETQHSLTLPASTEADISLYYSYVMQGFAQLPKEESRHARLEAAVYHPESGELEVRFATTRPFSNAAVMAEDAAGTDFLRPRYEIGDDYVRAFFKVGGGSSLDDEGARFAPDNRLLRPYAPDGAGLAMTEQGDSGGSATGNEGSASGTSNEGSASGTSNRGNVDGTGLGQRAGAEALGRGFVGGEVAISATFNDNEMLRTVIRPTVASGRLAKEDVRFAGEGVRFAPDNGLLRLYAPDGGASGTGNRGSGRVTGNGDGAGNRGSGRVTGNGDGAGNRGSGRVTGNGDGAGYKVVSEAFSAGNDSVSGFAMTEQGKAVAAIPAPGSGVLLMFGFMLLLMPGGFYLYFQLLRLIWMRDDRRRILAGYGVGAALALALLGIGYNGRYFGEMYQNPWLLAGAAAVILSLFAESLGYMDFRLFRPLKTIMPRGMAAGLFAVLLGTVFPAAYKAEALSGLLARGVRFSAAEAEWLAPEAASLWGGLALVWLGMMILPLAALAFRTRYWYLLTGFRRFNILYNGLYIIWLAWLVFAGFGPGAAVLLPVGLALLFGIWYIFPQAAIEATKRLRSEARKKAAFATVQKHWLALVLVWTGLMGGGLQLAGAEAPRATAVIERGVAAPAMTDKIAGAGIWLFNGLKKIFAPAGDTESADNMLTQALPPAEGNETADNATADKTDTPAEAFATGADMPAAVLIFVGADYSPKSLYSLAAAKQLAGNGVRVIRADASGDGLNALPWFAAYRRFYAPLFILYTARHPGGLVLPENLNGVDFNKALAGWSE